MSENKVNWHPSYVGEKRFGNWLENMNDWAISRNIRKFPPIRFLHLFHTPLCITFNLVILFSFIHQTYSLCGRLGWSYYY